MKTEFLAHFYKDIDKIKEKRVLDAIAKAIENVENAVDIRNVQQLLGHNNIKTTKQYTQVANTLQVQIKSPLDKLNMKTDIEKPP